MSGLPGLSLVFWVALACALLPFAGVHVAYWLSESAGHVPSCFPYLDSCTSISATGRHPPASFVFRATMLPSAMLMMVHWLLHAQFLRETGHSMRRYFSIVVLGVTASLGLILYVTVLGEIGDLLRTQRRIGTVLFFSFTFLAQLLLASTLRKMSEQIALGASKTGKRMLIVCQVMLAIGVCSVAVQAYDPDLHDRIEDAVEWQLALLLQLNFLLSALYWKRSDWRLGFVKPKA